MPGSPAGYPPEHWTGSSGVRCRPGSGGRRPVDFAGLAPAGRSHPLGAEKVAAWPLASLGHRNLTPGLLRQLVAALLHGPALTVSQPGFAGTPESLILRTGPGRLRRPHRKAGRNVQHVPHPQGRQALPEGRRHPEGVVRRDPSSLQVAPLLCPPHHLQGQLHLGPVALPILQHTAASHRSLSEVQLSGRYSPLSTNARPNGLT